MKIMTKLLAVLLCAVLVLGVSGCNQEDTSWVYEANGEQLPAGVYLRYMMTAYEEANDQYMSQRYAGAGDDEVWVYPDQKELLDGPIDGVSGAAWIEAKTQEYIMQYYGAYRLADELGYTLSSEAAASAATLAENYYAGAKALYEANGVGERSLELYFRAEMLKTELLEQIYGSGSATGMSDTDIAAAMNRYYVKASLMDFQQQVAGEEEDAEAQAAAETANTELLALAQSYLDRLIAGEEVDELLYEYRQSIAEDPSTVEKPDKANWQITFEIPDQPYGYDLYDDIIATPIGQGGILDAGGYYTVYHRVDISGDADALDQYRTSTLLREKGDELEARMLQASASYGTINSNAAALSRYTADKVVVTVD